MRKILFAAVGLAALAGAAGLAVAQDGGPPGQRGHFGLFQADSNNDGVLTRQEFDAGRDAMFARQDANNDGQLTSEERRAGHARHGGRRGGGGHGGHLMSADANNDGSITRDEFLRRPTEHFARLDANNDGVISADERPQRGERSQRGDRPNPDANGDGQIARAEFAAMGASMFERLDANGDGRITREEAEAGRQHRRGR